jgi:hypothetical protein
MKLKVLKIWLLATVTIMFAVLVIVVIRFGSIYERAESGKNRDFLVSSVSDVPRSKKILATVKINNKTQTPININFNGGKVTIDEMEIKKTEKNGYEFSIRVEGKMATFSSASKPLMIFRQDMLNQKKDSVEEVKYYRRYFITVETLPNDGENPVYNLMVESIDQTESKFNAAVLMR